MQNTSINDLTLLEITDGAQTRLGCDQEWYRSWWKRTAGCGPSTFANIIYYIKRRSGEITAPMPRADFVTLMEDVWESVTPTMHGLASTAAFATGARDYIRRHGLTLTAAELTVPRQKDGRPAPSQALEFITGVLANDAPVAFLALDNGDEKQLDSWHWVTLLSARCGGDGTLSAEVLDNGKLATVDLSRWLATTGRGGGFAGVF